MLAEKMVKKYDTVAISRMVNKTFSTHIKPQKDETNIQRAPDYGNMDEKCGDLNESKPTRKANIAVRDKHVKIRSRVATSLLARVDPLRAIELRKRRRLPAVYPPPPPPPLLCHTLLLPLYLSCIKYFLILFLYVCYLLWWFGKPICVSVTFQMIYQ